jgi:transcriptional regulator with XRE-family HTH domain
LAGFGAWARRERDARGWSQDVAVDELEKLTGNKVTRNWLSQIENGATPSADLVRDFERLYGEFSPSKSASADLGALVAALDRQTDAILELARATRGDVAELRRHVDDRIDRLLEAAAQGSAQGAQQALEWARREGYLREPAESRETSLPETAPSRARTRRPERTPA